MNRPKIHQLLGVLLVGFTAPVAAQNLLTNGDFDAGLGSSGWHMLIGTGGLGADSGTCSLSSGFDVNSAPTGGGEPFSLFESTECIPVDPGTTPELFLAALSRSSATVSARLYLRFSSDAACSSFASWSAIAAASARTTWSLVHGSVPVPGNVQAFQLEADFNPQVSGLPPFSGSWDRFYVGVEPQLFLDGFETESGSACHWSNVSP